MCCDNAYIIIYINNMRLLSHNILVCNVLKCANNSLPFQIQVDRSEYRESEFNREHILKLIRKLEWSSLYKTVTAVRHRLCSSVRRISRKR